MSHAQWRHVSARHASREEWQGASLLEHCGEPTGFLAAYRAEASALPGGNQRQWRQVALFPEDRQAPELAHEVVHVRLSELQVKRPRQWGACWLSGELWQQLQRDDFWRERLGVSREGTDWLDVLQTLVSYRLISPGSEWASTPRVVSA